MRTRQSARRSLGVDVEVTQSFRSLGFQVKIPLHCLEVENQKVAQRVYNHPEKDFNQESDMNERENTLRRGRT